MEDLTAAELVLLGLLAEKPRHGYELESVIQERGVREWTSLAFSSIYYVLHKLEGLGLVTSEHTRGQPKGRRTYALTACGRAACERRVREVLETVTPWHAPVLVGLANASLLPRDELVAALRVRMHAVAQRIAGLRRAHELHAARDVLVEGIFEHGLTMLQAELNWIHALQDRLEGTLDAELRRQEGPA